jgi:hypothetical protein
MRWSPSASGRAPYPPALAARQAIRWGLPQAERALCRCTAGLRTRVGRPSAPQSLYSMGPSSPFCGPQSGWFCVGRKETRGGQRWQKKPLAVGRARGQCNRRSSDPGPERARTRSISLDTAEGRRVGNWREHYGGFVRQVGRPQWHKSTWYSRNKPSGGAHPPEGLLLYFLSFCITEPPLSVTWEVAG